MAETSTDATQSEVGREDTTFPPFNVATFPSQLFWFAIVFIAIYLLMSRVALPRLGGLFAVRRARIDKDLEEATNLQHQADEAGAAYERTLAEAKARAQALAQEMRDKLAAASEARRKELEGSLGERLAQAEREIAATRTQAMANVDSIAGEAAAAIIRHLTGATADAAAISRALASFKPA
jgi:F-type H+-transporting ATPase subunit b